MKRAEPPKYLQRISCLYEKRFWAMFTFFNSMLTTMYKMLTSYIKMTTLLPLYIYSYIVILCAGLMLTSSCAGNKLLL